MNRNQLFLAAALICLAAAGASLLLSPPKSAPRSYRIGVINYSQAAEPALEGLRAGLAELGYAEGTRATYIYAGTIRDRTRLAAEARRLNDAKVDLIFAMSTPATLAAKNATRTSGIPVIFGPVSSPVQAGIVDHLSQPGGNVTGVTFGPQEPRRLEMLLKLVPTAKKIYIPFNPDDESPRLGIERIRSPAAKLGISMHLAEVRSEAELIAALNAIPSDVDAIFMPTDSMLVALTPIVADFCIERGLPLTTPHRQGVSDGALYSYGFSIPDVGHQAARMVAQVFSGVAPRDLPVELTEFVLAVNLKTARHLKLTLPESLLRHAITEDAIGK